jgi:hypothetical protein
MTTALVRLITGESLTMMLMLWKVVVDGEWMERKGKVTFPELLFAF